MKMQTAGAGGPTQERELLQTVDKLDEEYCKESISLMNHTTDQEIVMQKIKETFNYRQRLIHNVWWITHHPHRVSKAAGH